MKTCIKCKKDKELKEFRKRKKSIDNHNNICRECQCDYQKKHYLINKQKYVDKAKSWKDKERNKFFEYLKSQKCKDCGESDPIVLEFDHQGNKEFNIAHKIGIIPFKELLKEINKCEVVCSNCHKKRTAKTFNWKKAFIV